MRASLRVGVYTTCMLTDDCALDTGRRMVKCLCDGFSRLKQSDKQPAWVLEVCSRAKLDFGPKIARIPCVGHIPDFSLDRDLFSCEFIDYDSASGDQIRSTFYFLFKHQQCDVISLWACSCGTGVCTWINPESQRCKLLIAQPSTTEHIALNGEARPLQSVMCRSSARTDGIAQRTLVKWPRWIRWVTDWAKVHSRWDSRDMHECVTTKTTRASLRKRCKHIRVLGMNPTSPIPDAPVFAEPVCHNPLRRSWHYSCQYLRGRMWDSIFGIVVS